MSEEPTGTAGRSPDTPPGIHHLPLDVDFEGRMMTLHPAAVETPRGLLLLDTGFPGTLDQLAAALDTAGFALDDVATVLLTHQDGDHAGNLAAVLDRTAAFVVAHAGAAPVIDGREATRGPPDDERYPPARVDLALDGEAVFPTAAGPARVVPTPGHTPGHVSLYFPDERFLVAADALTAEGGRLAGPRPDVSVDLTEAMASVTRLADLDAETTLCYHGGLVDAGSERIAEIAADG